MDLLRFLLCQFLKNSKEGRLQTVQTRMKCGISSGPALFTQKKKLFEQEYNTRIYTILVKKLSCDMRFPTMWYVRPAKPQISLRIGTV